VRQLAEDVAWTVGKGRFQSRTGKEQPVRWSGVLVREDGRWRFVHSHASIAVPNEKLFDQ
jgi:hypothetical protein